MDKEIVSVDSCVIGSSINGLWIALELAKKGQKVLLVDKTPIGSQKNSIDVCLSYTCDKNLYGLALKAQKKWFALDKVFGSELNTEIRGSISFALNNDKMKTLENTLMLQKDYSEDLGSFIIKNREGIKALMKSSDIGDAVQGALVSVEDLSVNHQACINLLRKEIIQKDVKYWGDDEVVNFTTEGNKIKYIETKEAKIEAKNIVLATGVQSIDLLKKLQLPMPIRPAKTHIIEYTSKAKLPKQIVHYKTKLGDYICKPMLNGRNHLIYMGIDDQMQATWSQSVNQQTVVSSMLEMIRILPILEYVDIQETNIIHTAITPDRLPYFGKTKFYKNLYMNIGYCGSKYLFVPMFAEKMAELIDKGKADEEFGFLNPDRLAKEDHEVDYEAVNNHEEPASVVDTPEETSEEPEAPEKIEEPEATIPEATEAVENTESIENAEQKG
ncbi:MAG: FAD-binding oxidoreductase [Proteobacteria bacterium]|nr:FAD-binding oxidoreductase [Pseudomonadota bacterium]